MFETRWVAQLLLEVGRSWAGWRQEQGTAGGGGSKLTATNCYSLLPYCQLADHTYPKCSPSLRTRVHLSLAHLRTARPTPLSA